MGFLRGVFGGNDEKSKSSSELLKDATCLKKNGNIDAAINTLRLAYTVIQREGISYGFDVYLRLPKFLLIAGRADEAWSEYNRMLAEGIAGKKPQLEMEYMEHSQLYGAMSLHLRKEGKYFKAAVFNAMSDLAWRKGLISQDRRKKLGSQKIEGKSFRNDLKKAGCEDIADDFIRQVEKALINPESISCGELSRRLCELKKD